MQTVRFDKLKDEDVIDIDDVMEDGKKIYCYIGGKTGNTFNFLMKFNDRYCWGNLEIGNYFGSYTSFKQALAGVGNASKVLIFSSQCEVKQYIEKNM